MNLQKFEPQNFNELEKLAMIAVKSGLLPDGINDEKKFIVIALKGAELGIPIMQAASSINVIKGKPAISSELMLALIYNRVPTAEVTFLESTDKTCRISAKRKRDEPDQIFSFTIEDAKRADLLRKQNWQQYPTAMLRARCISAMARAVFPDALMGASYTPEELGASVTISDDGEEKVIPESIPPENTPKKENKTPEQKYNELPEEVRDLFDSVATSKEMNPRYTICESKKWEPKLIIEWLHGREKKAKSEKENPENSEYKKLTPGILNKMDLVKDMIKNRDDFCTEYFWNTEAINKKLDELLVEKNKKISAENSKSKKEKNIVDADFQESIDSLPEDEINADPQMNQDIP